MKNQETQEPAVLSKIQRQHNKKYFQHCCEIAPNNVEELLEEKELLKELYISGQKSDYINREKLEHFYRKIDLLLTLSKDFDKNYRNDDFIFGRFHQKKK